MTRIEIAKKMATDRLIAIVRLKESSWCQKIIAALVEGGWGCIEITSNTPGYPEYIAQARKNHDQVLIGAGTIYNKDLARQAVSAGAQFLVTPNYSTEVIEVAHEHDIPVAMGAFTPTEVVNAHEAGADFIKLFPAESLGIPYLKALLRPLEDLKIFVVGGVDQENLPDWFNAGAAGAGLGSGLFDPELLSEQYLAEITKNAATFKRKAFQS